MIKFQVLDINSEDIIDSSEINYIKSKILYDPVSWRLGYILNGGCKELGWEYDPDLTDYLIDDSKLFLALAIDGSDFIGFVYGDKLGLQYIYVEPGWRRKKIGTTLLFMLFNHLYDNEVHSAFKNGNLINSIFNGDPGFINFFYLFTISKQKQA